MNYNNLYFNKFAKEKVVPFYLRNKKKGDPSKEVPFYLSNKGIVFNSDTHKLTAFDVSNTKNHKSLSLPAVSGKQGMQSSFYQNIPKKGPLPVGEYYIKPDQYQDIKDLRWYERRISAFGRGKFRGLEKAWGPGRYWLTSTDSNPTARSGFSIHGGRVPGSAGCIDVYDKKPSKYSEFPNFDKLHEFIQTNFSHEEHIPVKVIDYFTPKTLNYKY